MSAEGASVLDASALLAYLHAEPGAEIIEEVLVHGAIMSGVNWAEVLSKLCDETGRDVDTILGQLHTHGLPGGLVAILPLTEEDAAAIARLRTATRTVGLSLADRACLALALRTGLPVYTSDRAWQHVSRAVPIRVIR